jgi:hypothetical protein
MDGMDTTREQPWAGWHRRRGRAWEKVCEAATYDEAWSALLETVARRGSGDSAVLPAGAAPLGNAPGWRRLPGSFLPFRGE